MGPPLDNQPGKGGGEVEAGQFGEQKEEGNRQKHHTCKNANN